MLLFEVYLLLPNCLYTYMYYDDQRLHPNPIALILPDQQ